MSLTRRCRVANTEHVGPDLSGKAAFLTTKCSECAGLFPDKSGPTQTV